MKAWITVKGIRSASAEIISIVIGVLLALAVNEWNEDRVKQERSQEALANIVSEIESNIKLLTVAHENNKKTLDAINAERADGVEDESNSLSFVPALQIQDTAWKTMVSTGVSEFFEYDLLYKVSGIYGLQEIYGNLGMQLIQSMMGHKALLKSFNKEYKEQNDLFLENMTLIVEVEKALLSIYQARLAEFKTADAST